MNWTKSSAIAEILSSVAILMTLVYLTIEIQQNAKATEADTRQALLAADQQYLELFIASPELALLGYEPVLSDEEKTRLSYSYLTFVRIRENNWLQYENGNLDDATWRSYRNALVALLSPPNARTWWQNFGVERIFDSEFIAIVDAELATAPVFNQNPHVSAFD